MNENTDNEARLIEVARNLGVMDEMAEAGTEDVMNAILPHDALVGIRELVKKSEVLLGEYMEATTLLSQPSQQSGGVEWTPVTIETMPPIGRSILISWDNGDVSEGELTEEGWVQYRWSAKRTDSMAWQFLPKHHLAAQQPPRVDLSGVTAPDWATHVGLFWMKGDGEHSFASFKEFPVADLEKLLALPQTEKGEVWISADTKLPEQNELVLCYHPARGRFAGYFYQPEGWADDALNEPAEVTHWRPLPSPPQDAWKVKPN